ncbi:hypothetical protein LINPERPRIM_LOCUS11357 [Linum perenne]
MDKASGGAMAFRNPRTVFLIWSFYIIFFFALLRMAINNSSSSQDSHSTYNEQRARLYDKMATDLAEKGAAFLKHGETSQSLSLSDIFTLKDGAVTPVLKAANPPVRANVLYLKPEYSLPISEAVKAVFAPYFDRAIWFQNSTVYHFSMFHASHHITPVPVTEAQIEAEAAAVRKAVESFCPLKIILDRVVLTSTGVLLGCWQVSAGTDPVTIRSRLKTLLPRAPEKQLMRTFNPVNVEVAPGQDFTNVERSLKLQYDSSILHTSFARLLGHPTSSSETTLDAMQLFQDLVVKLNNKLRGTQAEVSELWYVEEHDVLALALDGRMKVRRFQLSCKQT